MKRSLFFFCVALHGAFGLVSVTRAESTDSEWTTVGRTYNEQFFSPLSQINSDNVKGLGLAWYQDLGTRRGMEATPLVANGVLYNIAPWNIVTALDARTGKVNWTFDPEVPRDFGRLACCDVVTRGLALWKDKVIIAALDGRLIALNANTGKPVWSVNSLEGAPRWPYTVTGAPRVFDGKVLIGNGGADLGARGFVSAFDVETGRRLWRFYTVPGDPRKGFENEAMRMAAKTWNGRWWKWGGGGTVWDAITYDPELRLVYIGVGNGSPWVQKFRSPGGGDNLFLASIVALRVDTGEYVWHFQEVPGEQYDSTATQPIVQADLLLDGRLRKVLLHAPKNGFFYVLDRATGEFISANNLTPVNWTEGLDRKGRPKPSEIARYGETPVLLSPGMTGVHNWNPMAFDPLTGLVYLPITQNYGVFAAGKTFTPIKNIVNTGTGGGASREEQRALQTKAASMARAWLAAWDPIKQKEVWRVDYPSAGSGGVLATAGNLIFQGTVYKTLAAYRADSGAKVWEMTINNIPMAAPMSFMLDGVQYIAVNAGYGGGLAHVEAAAGRGPNISSGRLLVFKLGGTATLPPLPEQAPPKPPPRIFMTDTDVARGEKIYTTYCQSCHGTLVRGGIKDLRYMSDATRESFDDIVLHGQRKAQGMASFGDVLKANDTAVLLKYITLRAYEDYGPQ